MSCSASTVLRVQCCGEATFCRWLRKRQLFTVILPLSTQTIIVFVRNMAHYLKDEVDIEYLIELIRSRPALYDRKEISTQETRKKLWNEITAQIYYTSWHQFSAGEKENAAKQVKQRWKNLRTCFGREIKTQREGTKSARRRTYQYFNKLLFLLPSLEAHEMGGKIGNVESDKDDDDVYREENGLNNTENNQANAEDVSHVKWEPASPRSLYEESVFEANAPKQYENASLRPLRSSYDDLDAETHFALSLVPLLRAVPASSKIDAHIDILKTLKKYSTTTHLRSRPDIESSQTRMSVPSSVSSQNLPSSLNPSTSCVNLKRRNSREAGDLRGMVKEFHSDSGDNEHNLCTD